MLMVSLVHRRELSPEPQHNRWLYFPPGLTLREVEFGAVMTIDENLYDGSINGSPFGKAQGLYVASSEDGTGKYVGANGYVTDEAVELRFNAATVK
ncbi:hypothetical protein DITRI_Ditri01bG0181200 [Diplodiscus trichospermus]